MSHPPNFPLYRGLQKPLVFKSFRGRYIYWGLGSILTALLSAMVLFSTTNLMTGLITMTLVLGSGLGYTAYRQQRGPKPIDKGLAILPNQPIYEEV